MTIESSSTTSSTAAAAAAAPLPPPSPCSSPTSTPSQAIASSASSFSTAILGHSHSSSIPPFLPTAKAPLSHKTEALSVLLPVMAELDSTAGARGGVHSEGVGPAVAGLSPGRSPSPPAVDWDMPSTMNHGSFDVWGMYEPSGAATPTFGLSTSSASPSGSASPPSEAASPSGRNSVLSFSTGNTGTPTMKNLHIVADRSSLSGLQNETERNIPGHGSAALATTGDFNTQLSESLRGQLNPQQPAALLDDAVPQSFQFRRAIPTATSTAHSTSHYLLGRGISSTLPSVHSSRSPSPTHNRLNQHILNTSATIASTKHQHIISSNSNLHSHSSNSNLAASADDIGRMMGFDPYRYSTTAEHTRRSSPGNEVRDGFHRLSLDGNFGGSGAATVTPLQETEDYKPRVNTFPRPQNSSSIRDLWDDPNFAQKLGQHKDDVLSTGLRMSLSHRTRTAPADYDPFNPFNNAGVEALNGSEANIFRSAAEDLQAWDDANLQLRAASLRSTFGDFQPGSYGMFANSQRPLQNFRQDGQDVYGRTTQFSAVPPPGYVCKLCLVEGHWMKSCMLYREKRRESLPGLHSGTSSPYSDEAYYASIAAKQRLLAGQSRPHQPSAVPPEGYVCRKCNVPGHWIQRCPLNLLQQEHQKLAYTSLPTSVHSLGPTRNLAFSQSLSQQQQQHNQQQQMFMAMTLLQHERRQQKIMADVAPSSIPPETYVCKICGIPGHWIQACPMKNVNRTFNAVQDSSFRSVYFNNYH
ncbi:hypothetical protein DFJ73DRAFT_764403 [Zopfochytrium polystomum]|nr:hypothetical protein DFJ73DRAFT_764403 [Zopfochytrium polystomum]